MKKKITIQFHLSTWLSHEISKVLPLKQTDPEVFNGDSYKEKCVEENEERRILKEFIEDLRLKYKENKELIRAAENDYSKRTPHPFPDPIPYPVTVTFHAHKRLLSAIERDNQLYVQLLNNNNIPCYYELIERVTDDHNRRRSIAFPLSTEEDRSYCRILQCAIQLGSAKEFQSCMESLEGEYEKLEKIDSKKDASEKQDQIWHDFHKMLRQTDALGNGHVDSLIWNLLYLTNLPHRIFKALIEYVKEGVEVID